MKNDWKRIFAFEQDVNVRFWHLADILSCSTCPFRGQSGHGRLHCTCLLLTQSGHDDAQRGFVNQMSWPMHRG